MKYLVTDIETTPTSGIGKTPEPTPEKPDPFPPNPCHVPVVIGNLLFDGSYTCVDSRVLSQRTRTEKEMLEVFSSYAKDMNLVTWNGRSFDVPVIVLRCLRHGVPLKWYFKEKFGARYRYNDGEHCDVMEQVSNYGATKNLSLNDVAQIIGLPGKLDVDGANVQEMWAGGLEAEVENYCMTDVVQTAFIWLRFEYTRGRLTLDHYVRAATILIERCRTNALRYGELLDKTDMKILLLEGDDGRSVEGTNAEVRSHVDGTGEPSHDDEPRDPEHGGAGPGDVGGPAPGDLEGSARRVVPEGQVGNDPGVRGEDRARGGSESEGEK